MSNNWHNEYNQLRKATEDRPNDGLAWAELGDFLARESNSPSLTVRAYERARDLLPERDLRLRLGLAHVSNGDKEKGFTMIQESAAEKPRAEAYCFLSDAYYRDGQMVKAEDAAREAIRLDPSFEEGYYLLGNVLRRRDRHAAIEKYRTALALDHSYSLAWQALGRELISVGDTSEGVSALEQALSIDPDDVWTRTYLANGLWKLGKLDDAQKQYLAAIDIAPEFPELQRWYEEFLAASETSRK